jgi:glycine/D-amino acid oxidase-like deaminating enzyme
VYDVIVVGAGLPGLMAAWRLAERGLAVAVFDRGVVAAESSALAAGHVPQRAYTRATLDVLRRTRAVVEELERRTGGIVRYRRVGGLRISTTEAGLAAFAEQHAQLREWGVPSEVLPPEEVRARWPDLGTDDVKAGHFCPDDGFVRSLDLTVVLGAFAQQAGATIHEGCPVERIDIADASVRGVVVAGEQVVAPRVVLAAGAWSLPLARASGFAVPLKPFVLSALILLNVPVDVPFVADAEHGYYLIKRNPDSLLLGLPPMLVGISPELFARSAGLPDQARFVDLLGRRVPAARNAAIGAGWAGLLVGTPDNYPLLGGYGGIEGLYLATGFAGGGLQRVAAVEALAQVVQDQEPSFPIAEYAASRFDGYRGEDFPFQHGAPHYYDDRAGPARAYGDVRGARTDTGSAC